MFTKEDYRKAHWELHRKRLKILCHALIECHPVSAILTLLCLALLCGARILGDEMLTILASCWLIFSLGSFIFFVWREYKWLINNPEYLFVKHRIRLFPIRKNQMENDFDF